MLQLLKFDPEGLDWILLNEERRTSIEQYNNIASTRDTSKKNCEFFYGGTYIIFT